MTLVFVAPSAERTIQQLRREFIALPGLCLSVRQVARMLSIDLESAKEALDRLELEGLLERTDAGTYRRVARGFSRAV